ncbi:uncharacterized protein LOC113334014 [Papaver somniferum]|uniref:uncharacterized protein LOC113334014 n=1 Tax=Papaver somniferum TaxID=3469 RepID=UPI000E705CAE|nr:uncharacterized protein LOC113334014 [Papaver somniferum]
MSNLMSKLISSQQVAHIKGKCIQEKILLASDMVNEMKKKRRGGNVGLKLDISQAYDSNWEFLLKVLSKYGFSNSWCEWLHTIFKSAKISVMINGGTQGFFCTERGLRQGDPLSPILFVLMEDVVSRNLTQMVQNGDIEPMVIRKGQLINTAKSKLFIEGTTSVRKIQIQQMIQMDISSFPDKYLGIILHPGRVKASTIWPMVEMMQKKLAAWKGLAGFGVVVRDHLCQVICTLTGGLGITTNYIAEVFAITCAAELAVEWKLGNIILISDSQTVINEFTSGKIPWFIKNEMEKTS